MPLLIHPCPGTIFRIQSADFQTCIELVEGSEDNVRLRSPDDTSEYQYWRFEKKPDDGRYFIINVANSTQCLRVGTQISDPIYAGEASGDNGLFIVSTYDGSFRLIFQHDDDMSDFCTDSYGKYVYIEKIDNMEETPGWRWRLVPVDQQRQRQRQLIDNDLPGGTYRIRSHDGRVILTMPEESTGRTNVYARSQLDQSDFQRWTVTLKKPLEYSIQNAGNMLYLGCSANPPDVGHSLVGLEDKYIWNIRKVGSSTWSLRIPTADLSIGFPDYEIKNEIKIRLVPSDNTSSQLWLMEKDSPVIKIHEGRVAEGIYVLQNVNSSAYMNTHSIPWRIIPGSSPSASPYKFELKYIDEISARFTLAVTKTTASGVLKVTVVPDAVEYPGLNRIGTEFVLEKDEGDLGYVICLPDPHKVISGRTTTDINGIQVFTFEKQMPGDLMQMWKFVLVP